MKSQKRASKVKSSFYCKTVIHGVTRFFRKTRKVYYQARAILTISASIIHKPNSQGLWIKMVREE